MTHSAEKGLRLFDVPAETVVSGAGCSWCAADVGALCREPQKWLGEFVTMTIPHAQRWRDYWNVSHDRLERVEVYPAPWSARVIPTAEGSPREGRQA